MEPHPPEPENLRIIYEELCKSYHNIDDFRAKLLGFLPLATAAGIVLTSKANAGMLHRHPVAIGMFGFVIAFGLFSYEIFGIQKCAALIETGKQLEQELRIEGQFATRPREVLWIIDEPLAAALIYPAVLASWLYVILYKPVGPTCLWLSAPASLWVSGAVFVGLFSAIVVWARRLASKRKQPCYRCEKEFDEDALTRMISASLSKKHCWLCDKCYEEARAWLRAKRAE